jgi:hypothetical protein
MPPYADESDPGRSSNLPEARSLSSTRCFKDLLENGRLFFPIACDRLPMNPGFADRLNAKS